MLLTLIMLLFCSVQAKQFLCSTVCGSISKGVSFTLPIACRLLFNRVCNKSYYSSLGHYLLESCFSSEISKHEMRVGRSLPLPIIAIVSFIEVNNSYIATG